MGLTKSKYREYLLKTAFLVVNKNEIYSDRSYKKC